MKIKKCFNLFILAVISTLLFIACFNDRQGKEASIILNLGKSAGNRAAAWRHEEEPGILEDIVYKVVIDGPDHIEIESTGRTTIKTTVTPGIYTITVEAYYLYEPYAKNTVENITIKAGSNFVPISLKPWNEIPDMDPAKTYLIADGIKMEFASLSIALKVAKFEQGKNLEEAGLEELIGLGLEKFTVSIGDGYHYLNNDTGGSISDEEKVIIEKHGSGTAYIKLSTYSGCVFSVSGELTLQGNITLIGVEENYYALIVVNDGGTLNIYDNVIIKENQNNDDSFGGYGGGVFVDNGGTFNMYSGTITGNTAVKGGGVEVYSGGTFNMYSGKITGNTAANGGGVYVEDCNAFSSAGGTFNMYGGTITGNTAVNGGGVYIKAGNPSFTEDGTFTKYGDDGTINGNTSTNGGDDVYIDY